jgi:hypothetical protein
MAPRTRTSSRQGAKLLLLGVLLGGSSFTTGCLMPELLPLLSTLFDAASPSGGGAVAVGSSLGSGPSFGPADSDGPVYTGGPVYGEEPVYTDPTFGGGMTSAIGGFVPPASPPVLETPGVSAPTVRPEAISAPPVTPTQLTPTADPVPETWEAPTSIDPTRAVVTTQGPGRSDRIPLEDGRGSTLMS